MDSFYVCMYVLECIGPPTEQQQFLLINAVITEEILERRFIKPARLPCTRHK